MKILAVPRLSFNEYMKLKGVTQENISSIKEVAFISINNTIDNVEPYFLEDRPNLKVLFFDDVSEDIYTNDLKNPGDLILVKAMTEEQAKELYTFIKANEEKDCIIIHCTAGVSRSGAVATFINDYVSGDWHSFKQQNSSIQPNTHVYKLLKKIWLDDLESKKFEKDSESGHKTYFNNNSKP